jgi:glycosyltransferase involved in cell wall biosynthesis
MRKVAIIHDWLVTYAGAEKVLEQLLNLYPDADLFSTVDFLEDTDREFIKHKKVNTTFIQNLPLAKKKYRTYLPFMPIAIEQLDLSGYDLIISSSHAVAKGIITSPNQIHVCYIHSPIRYAWDLQHQYLKEANLLKGLKSLFARSVLHYMRMWDVRTSNGVDYFIANSQYIAKRVKKVYNRDAEVIYPPVEVEKFPLEDSKKEFYLTASRFVPYKKIDIIVEAFNKMPDKELIVIGDGPDFNKIKNLARDNVKLLGYQSFEKLQYYMRYAKAFVFAAEEDFGIVPVEAQACGTPVIAYGKGGALETVKDPDSYEAPTGVFFRDQTSESIIGAVKRFEQDERIMPKACRENALRFSVDQFKEQFTDFIENKTLS